MGIRWRLLMTDDKYEVYLEYNGPQVQYDAEFEGTEEQCHEYISDTLMRQRALPGMQDTGTFLRIRQSK